MNIIKFIRENCHVDSIGRNKAGEFVARREFFYRHGHTSDNLAADILAALPSATILQHGENWKPFRGGASTANSSHWFVRFTVPAEESIQRGPLSATRGEVYGGDRS